MYLGKLDANKIVQGEVKANRGDTFLSETIDRHGFIAFKVLTGQRVEVITHGTYDLCFEKAQKG